MNVLAKQQAQATSKAKKTSDKQEGNLMASSEVNTANVDRAGGHEFFAINSLNSFPGCSRKRGECEKVGTH